MAKKWQSNFLLLNSSHGNVLELELKNTCCAAVHGNMNILINKPRGRDHDRYQDQKIGPGPKYRDQNDLLCGDSFILRDHILVLCLSSLDLLLCVKRLT